VLINQGQRQNSNLCFRTLHAEQQRNTFMSNNCQYIGGILPIRYIGNIVISAIIYVCRYIGRALLKTRNHGMSIFSLKGPKSRSCERVALKIFNASQFTRLVLLQNEVCYTKYHRFYS